MQRQATAVAVDRRGEVERPATRLVLEMERPGLAVRWWGAWVRHAAAAMQAGVK